jgi:hypothetical protein
MRRFYLRGTPQGQLHGAFENSRPNAREPRAVIALIGHEAEPLGPQTHCRLEQP